ncbi:uncharacterized protein V6R79_009304 [Siganus canaliculatus]
MPSFALMDKVELFIRTGKFHPDASRSSRKVTRAASQHFVYKDGCLWRSYRGRLLRVVRNDDEVREILIRYHDNNNHAGRVRTVRQIMLMYYWTGVTESVCTWIKACPVCQDRIPTKPSNAPIRFCLVYGCDASSFRSPELDFYRFPKDGERRRQWLAVAQRDEGSLRSNSRLCSRHFESSCFTLSEDGQRTLVSDAVPTIVHVAAQEDEVPAPSDEDFLPSNSLEELLSSAAATESSDPPQLTYHRSDTPLGLQEHQYCLPTPDPDSGTVLNVAELKKRETVIEPSFTVYNQIARYLTHRILPPHNRKSRFAFKRMAKRFSLADGVLMYMRGSSPLRVPRSRDEVNSIIKQFHDNKGHRGHDICQRAISKHFYWAGMNRDLSLWISRCLVCINRTKRKWLRCSVSNCTNCCGPVERGLGLTFHRFPFHDQSLLTRWLRVIGRPSWHPRLWSSVCSAHFSEDCFDRGGEKVVLRPDAVPTLCVHSATPSRGAAPPAGGEEAYFAKYDAVELYMTKRTYPPGLSYVEKNTFRRFCKNFTVQDDRLHMVRGGRMCLVLRSRQQVETALTDFHNELNHLGSDKCLRLLRERFFWKTMRPDVVQWINRCSLCSSRKRTRKTEDQAAGEPGDQSLVDGDQDSGRDDDDDEDCGGDEEEEEAGPAVPVEQEAANQDVREVTEPHPASSQPQKMIPILLHLRTPIVLQPKTPSAPFVTRVWSLQKTTPQQPEVQSSPPGTGGSAQLPPPCLQFPASSRESPVQAQTSSIQKKPEKRKKDLESGSPAKKSSNPGLDPIVVPSSKPWPVFTITSPAQTQTSKTPAQAKKAPVQRSRRLQARVVVQRCSQAQVKTRPAVDSAEAQWAEIQEGMVVFVSFFHRASEDVVHEMADSLMTTKLFRKDSAHMVSVLNLPGSVLLVPQDSLVGEPAPGSRVQYRGGCEPWRGAQLFSSLVAACRGHMSASAKCSKAGVMVDHGVYGQRQELVLKSEDPLTLLLEF